MSSPEPDRWDRHLRNLRRQRCAPGDFILVWICSSNLARAQYGGSVPSTASLLCMGLLLRKFNRPVLNKNGFAAQGCGCGSGKRVKSDAAGPPTGNEAPCVQLLSYNGGRSELRSRFRSALSPWIDRRMPIDIIRDRLEERSVKVTFKIIEPGFLILIATKTQIQTRLRPGVIYLPNDNHLETTKVLGITVPPSLAARSETSAPVLSRRG